MTSKNLDNEKDLEVNYQMLIYFHCAEAIELGRLYWILHPVSCHTPEAVTTVIKCS